MDTIHFAERQKFNAWWVSILNVFLLLLVGYTCYELLAMGAGWTAYLAPMGLLLLIIGTASVTLRTQISDSEIVVGFSPLLRKRIARQTIAAAYVRTYDPILEYGGWGWRRGPNGTAFNTMGNRGLQLELKSGQRILVGTQQPVLLQQVMAKWMGGGGAGAVPVSDHPG